MIDQAAAAGSHNIMIFCPPIATASSVRLMCTIIECNRAEDLGILKLNYVARNEDFAHKQNSSQLNHCSVYRPDCIISGIDRVIVGGESGPGARPMGKESATAIRNVCIKAQTPFFFKQ